MIKDYEKHQRDYTILATSLVMEEFFSPRFENYYFSRTRPMYLLIKEGILYHYLAIAEKRERSRNCLQKYSFNDLKNYIKQTDVELQKYRIFLKQDHKDILESLEKLHAYMTLFVTIIILCAETPLYEKLDNKIWRLLLAARKRYDNVHKVGISLERKLLSSLEKKLKVKPNTFNKLLANEFRQFLKDASLPADIQKRDKFFFAVHNHSGHKKYSLPAAQKIIKSLEPKLEIIKNNEIKGQVAFKGKLRGKVRLIKLVAEAKSLKKGEVLVTAMTDPRYIQAMKKAAAIVTDEGGITCHAAIVARELKKPCIIGTKIATQVLRSGDEVEVDAVKGIVKIIRNK